jgi:hypothetical protein
MIASKGTAKLQPYDLMMAEMLDDAANFIRELSVPPERQILELINLRTENCQTLF